MSHEARGRRWAGEPAAKPDERLLLALAAASCDLSCDLVDGGYANAGQVAGQLTQRSLHAGLVDDALVAGARSPRCSNRGGCFRVELVAARRALRSRAAVAEEYHCGTRAQYALSSEECGGEACGGDLVAARRALRSRAAVSEAYPCGAVPLDCRTTAVPLEASHCRTTGGVPLRSRAAVAEAYQ